MRRQTFFGFLLLPWLTVLAGCPGCSSAELKEDALSLSAEEAAGLAESAQALWERADAWDGPEVDRSVEEAAADLLAALVAPTPEGRVFVAPLRDEVYSLAKHHADGLEAVMTGEEPLAGVLAKAYLVEENTFVYGMGFAPFRRPLWAESVPAIFDTLPIGSPDPISDDDIWSWEAKYESEH